MAKKPVGDLGAMELSKAKAANTVPFGAVATAAPNGGSVKSLTVKLDGDTYAALRAYCYEFERTKGTRLTHQQVMVQALQSFLANPS